MGKPTNLIPNTHDSLKFSLKQMTRSRTSLHGGSLSGSPESGDDSSDSKSEKDDNSPPRGRHVERSDEHVDPMDIKS